MIRHYLLGMLFTCSWNPTVFKPLRQSRLNSTDQCQVLLWEHISSSATVAINRSKHILGGSCKVAVNLGLYCLMVVCGMTKTLGKNLSYLKTMPSYAGYLPTSRSEIGHSSFEHIYYFPKYALSVEFHLDFSFSSNF